MVRTQNKSLSRYRLLSHNLFHVCTTPQSSTGLQGELVASLRPKLEKAGMEGCKSVNTMKRGKAEAVATGIPSFLSSPSPPLLFLLAICEVF